MIRRGQFLFLTALLLAAPLTASPHSNRFFKLKVAGEKQRFLATAYAPGFDQQVADEHARLSLTGLANGWRVKQVSTGCIYQFTPSTDLALHVTGADPTNEAALNCPYWDAGSNVNGKPHFVSSSDPQFVWEWGGAAYRWELRGANGLTFWSYEDVATPDLVSVWESDGRSGAIVVTTTTRGALRAGAVLSGSGQGASINQVYQNPGGSDVSIQGHAHLHGLTNELADILADDLGDGPVWQIRNDSELEYKSVGAITATIVDAGGNFVEINGSPPPPTSVAMRYEAGAENWTCIANCPP